MPKHAYDFISHIYTSASNSKTGGVDAAADKETPKEKSKKLPEVNPEETEKESEVPTKK